MPLFGAHMSIVGGYHEAALAAHRHGCGTVQLFTKAPNQWAGKPITAAEAKLFRRTVRESRLRLPLAHDSYLINLASPDPALWQKSWTIRFGVPRRCGLAGPFSSARS